MHYPLFAATLTVAVFLCSPGAASAHTEWVCGLSDDAVRLVCVAEPDLSESAAPAATSQAPVINGTSFPLDARRKYTVDLWSPPSDMAFVEQLARATICYRSPECRVVLNPRLRTSALKLR